MNSTTSNLEIESKGFGQESLAPQNVRIINNISYIFAWIAGVVNINSFMMGASLAPPLGKLNLLQSAVAMLIGISAMALLLTWNGQAGHKYGIPFIVQARTCFGTKGSVIPGFVRSVPAVFWFGVQSWIGASAINNICDVLFNFNNIVVCFIAFQILQIALSVLGFKGIKWLENIGAVFIICTLGFMFYIIYSNYSAEISTNLVNIKGTWGMPFITTIVTFAGTYTTFTMSVSDVTRELNKGTSSKLLAVLHWFGTVPATMFMAIIGLLVAGTVGSWDPITLFTELVPNKAILVVSLSFIAFAQVTTNVLFNVVPSAYVLMEYFKLSYAKSAIIVGVLAMLTMPWKIATGTGFLLFVKVYSAFLGPVITVLLLDYFILRKQQLDIDALYDENGPYTGVNWQGVIAILCGAGVALMFVDFSWVASIIPTSLVYLLLSKYYPISKKFLHGTIYENSK